VSRGGVPSHAARDEGTWGAPQGPVLDKTTVRAPADGYVTNVALRKGARVANLPLAPVMAFIDTADTIIGTEISQINARYVVPGQPADVTFKFMPGQVYGGKVESVLQAVASGQVQTSGLAATTKEIVSAPFVVRIRLDDAAFAQRLPAGSTGDAAIFTDHVKVAHIIRKVLLQGAAAPDRDPELCQSVLIKA
jgi:multidrug resistance efflux pump